MSRRRLRPDELELWSQVARTADPIHPAPKRPKTPPKSAPARADAPPQRPAPAPVQHFRMGEKAARAQPGHDVLPGLESRLKSQPVTMDHKAYGRLKRGKLTPEAKIDLHGMTADRAHGALTGFILRAHGQGKRLVLVITGKGRQGAEEGPIPVRRGVLRHNVPHWLSVPPLAGLVLQVTNAHNRHGGGGAYYVYLRKPR